MRVSFARRVLTRIAALAVAFAAGGAGAAEVPAGFQDSIVLTPRTQPTAVRFAPNGVVFVAEKSGLVWAYRNLADTSPVQVIDLRVAVHNYWDRGLLGLAVSPNYPTDPSIYVLYTHDANADGTGPRWGSSTPATSTNDNCPTPPGPTTNGCVVYGRLSRITVNTTTLTGTETPLITSRWCQQFPSHSVGDLVFDKDGYLYVSGGDGANFDQADWGQFGSPVNPCGDPPDGVGGPENGANAEGGALRSQDLLTPADATALSGAILRLDVSGASVQAAAGNPLVGNSVVDDDYIIGIGLRNPFRFTVRPGTNEVWISDVGWNTWEEINVIPSPGSPVEDFGWPCYEGGFQGGAGVNLQNTPYAGKTLCTMLYANTQPAGIARTAPYFAYLHGQTIVGEEGCGTGSSAIAGLAFNSGTKFPLSYANALFFTDAVRRCIWVMYPGTNGKPNPGNVQVFLKLGDGDIVDLQLGPDGNLYYPDFTNGNIHRITYFTGNQPPTPAIAASPSSGPAPLVVQFSAAGSTDPESGTNLTYAWDMDNDGQFNDATVVSPQWTFTGVGPHVVRVRVADPQGAFAIAGTTVTAGNTPPQSFIDSPTTALHWQVGQVINFSGHASDTQDGTLPGSQLAWDIIMHHCSTPQTCHTHPITSVTGASGSFTAPDHPWPSYIEFRLTATDLGPGPLTATSTVLVDPQTSDVTLVSTPAGGQMTLNAATGTSPFTQTVIVGGGAQVNAPIGQSFSSQPYAFMTWSDGGGAVHTVTTPATNLTLTATYGPDGDADGIANVLDNCTNVPNGPLVPDAGGNSQLDADGDLYGNACDPDLDGNGVVTAVDYAILRSVLGQSAGAGATAAAADLDGSGTVTASDYAILRKRLGKAPGPSGLRP